MAPNDSPSHPELFTASDVARFCQVDLKTIHNWAEKGEIRHFRTPGRHLRFRRLDVLDFLRKYGYPIPEVLREGKPRVIAIDDDPNVLASLRRVLSRRVDLMTFQDPFDALVAVGTAQPDAIILDIRMPGLDGIRLLERLKSIESTGHIRAIVYSSYEDLRRAALEAGAYDFILKGEVSELRDALEHLIGINPV